MSEHDEFEFQEGISGALARYDPCGELVRYMKMDKGSDVTNLTLQADIRVGRAKVNTEVCFSVLSYSWVKHCFEKGTDLRHLDPLAAGNLVLGQPMVVVELLTPDSAVRAILRYIRIEGPTRQIQ